MDPASLAIWFADSSFGWLALALALGLVHALDADHVMAVSVFATDRSGARCGARSGLRWSLGHGLMLIGVGVVLLLVGRAMPPALSAAAERAVGLTMVGLGVYVFVDLLRRRSHLHFHEHDGLPPHAHWHTHAKGEAHPHHAGHDHGAVMVGAIHGLAGSAPILAVLPASARSPALGLGYLIVFALGVALAMALMSGLLGHLAGRLARGGRARGLPILRASSAIGSIALGVWLVIGA